MSDADLHALIVNNLADLDAAVRRVWFTLEPAVAEAIDKIIDESREQAGWDGEVGWQDKGCWLAPSDWKKSGEVVRGDSHKCRFWLDSGLDDTIETIGTEKSKDAFWLTRLLGIGDGRLGFRWSRNDVRRLAWRKLVSEETKLISTLRAKGFEYEEGDGSFYLPVKVDQAALAAALAAETPVEALGPLRKALQTLVDAKPDFDALLRATASID
jgi:hypothetical protein